MVGSLVGWIDSPSFDRHSNGPSHPESPGRLEAIRAALERENLIRRLDRIEAPRVDREWLARVHSPGYLEDLERICRAGGGALDPDTVAVPDSWDAALRAAGAGVEAVRRVLAGEWRRGFCSVRPPGHHARPGTAMGFCLFANVAVAAEAALATPGISRVAILDWDVHHGNGTQEIFWERGEVLFASWHQYPFYPGTGGEDEVGEGAGRGTTVNVPLAAGSGDRELWRGWETRVRPALEGFEPDLVLVSAGFDGDGRDPLGGLRYTAAGYARLSQAVVDFSEQYCQGRLVSMLEGGYDLRALGEDTALHLGTML